MDVKRLLQRIKDTVYDTDPSATLILYGSYARGEQRDDSDIDLIVLIDKDEVRRADEIKITYPFYNIALDIEKSISAFVYSKKAWATHKATPYYENVNTEGVVL